MKQYTLNYRGHIGQYCCHVFNATCDTDARFIARAFYREHYGICALALFTKWGEYIEL